MKKICAIFFASLCVLSSYGQTPVSWYHYTEEFYFVKEVSVIPLQGKNFRYEIAVKANPADTLSKVRIHGVGVGKGADDFLHSDFTVETRTEQDWTIYTVIGTIMPEAKKLWFYAAVNGNGTFYFDDLSFYIEEQPGRWRQLHLFNASFEEKQPDIFAGYYVSRRKSAHVRTVLSRDVVKTGQKSLQVKTSGAAPMMAISSAMNP
jgi:threonyl-tRNA synthetase